MTIWEQMIYQIKLIANVILPCMLPTVNRPTHLTPNITIQGSRRSNLCLIVISISKNLKWINKELNLAVVETTQSLEWLRYNKFITIPCSLLILVCLSQGLKGSLLQMGQLFKIKCQTMDPKTIIQEWECKIIRNRCMAVTHKVGQLSLMVTIKRTKFSLDSLCYNDDDHLY